MSKLLQIFKTCFAAIFILLLVVAGQTDSYAQSTIGKDFWVTFLPNHDGSEVTLSLIAAGSRACSGTVVNPRTNWSRNFTVSVGVTTIIDIPLGQAFNVSGSDCVLNTGLHVISTDSISLYASNFREYTFDVTDVLPTASLGQEYIIQNYPPSGKGMTVAPDAEVRDGDDCSEFVIVATEDNTRVTIVLACNSANGHGSNSPFTVTLNSGQCYQIQSVWGGDLSGSRILVANNKKVAVFAGNRCASVPSEAYCCCDHIVDQMMPVSCWGQHFVVTNSKSRSKDVIRVTALNNNCKIFKNGSLVSTINARQTYQFEMTSSTPSAYLETTEPAMVYLYYTSAEYGGENGDPSVVIINPIEQKIKNVTFSTFNSGASQYHYVNLVTDSDNVSTMRLDGSSIASSFQPVSGNSEYSYARIQVNHGSHTLNNSNGGFVAHVYGLGSYESYAYSIGSMAINLTSNLQVNGQDIVDHPEGFDACEDNPLNFRVNLNYTPSRLNWNFGDGETGSGDLVTHSYLEEGDYEVSCEVYKQFDGQDSLMVTLGTMIHVHKSYHAELSVSHCDSYTWYGHTYTQSGDYDHHAQTMMGCDSIVTLHLSIYTVDTTYEIEACDEYWWYGQTYTRSGRYEHLGQTSSGCDSLEVLNLTINKSTDTYESVVSCDGYEWRGTFYTEPGTYQHEEGQTVHGCDSVAWLELSLNYTPDIKILGYSQVAHSSNLWHGIYYYYVVDSLLLEPGSVSWTCSNSSWIMEPVGNFGCRLIVKERGEGVLSVDTGLSTGCDTQSELWINATDFGVEEDGIDGVLVYPNPASSRVTVEAGGLKSVCIYNALGQMVKEKECGGDDRLEIDLSGMERGAYIVEVHALNRKAIKRLLVN